MVMVAVPVPGPPQVPGAVGHTSAAPESWMVKVAVFGSASAPLAVMTAPTALRAIVMTAIVTSRLPIGLLLRLAGCRHPAAAISNGRSGGRVTVPARSRPFHPGMPLAMRAAAAPVARIAAASYRQALTARGRTSGRMSRFPGAGRQLLPLPGAGRQLLPHGS